MTAAGLQVLHHLLRREHPNPETREVLLLPLADEVARIKRQKAVAASADMLL